MSQTRPTIPYIGEFTENIPADVSKIKDSYTGSIKIFNDRVNNLEKDTKIAIIQLKIEKYELEKRRQNGETTIEKPKGTIQNIDDVIKNLETRIPIKIDYLVNKLPDFVKGVKEKMNNFTQELKNVVDARKELEQNQNTSDENYKKLQANFENSRNKYKESLNDLMKFLNGNEGKFNAFSVSKTGDIATGVALWSKLHQNLSGEEAEAMGLTTLENSVSGYLMDGLKFGIEYQQANDDNLMTQFWGKMSHEIAEIADKEVALLVFEQALVESAFYMAEWPRIQKKMKEDPNFKGLVLTRYLLVEKLQEQQDKDIYLLNNKPTDEQLKANDSKYKDTYIFTKVPTQLFYVDQKGDVTELAIGKLPSNVEQYQKIVQEVTQGKDIHILESKPTDEQLKHYDPAKFNDSYIFTKKPPEVFHFQNGVLTPVNVNNPKEVIQHIDDIMQHQKAMKEFQAQIKTLKTSDKPMDKGEIVSQVGSDIIRSYTPATILREIINRNPGHELCEVDVIKSNPILIKEEAELMAFIHAQDADYKMAQSLYYGKQAKVVETKEARQEKLREELDSLMTEAQSNPRLKETLEALTTDEKTDPRLMETLEELIAKKEASTLTSSSSAPATNDSSPPPSPEISRVQAADAPKAAKSPPSSPLMSPAKAHVTKEIHKGTEFAYAGRRPGKALREQLNDQEKSDLFIANTFFPQESDKNQTLGKRAMRERQNTLRSIGGKHFTKEPLDIRQKNFRKDMVVAALYEGYKLSQDQSTQGMIANNLTSRAETGINHYELAAGIDPRFGEIKGKSTTLGRLLNMSTQEVIEKCLSPLAINTGSLNPAVLKCLMDHAADIDLETLTTNPEWVNDVNQLAGSEKTDAQLKDALKEKLQEIRIEVEPKEMDQILKSIRDPSQVQIAAPVVEQSEKRNIDTVKETAQQTARATYNAALSGSTTDVQRVLQQKTNQQEQNRIDPEEILKTELVNAAFGKAKKLLNEEAIKNIPDHLKRAEKVLSFKKDIVNEFARQTEDIVRTFEMATLNVENFKTPTEKEIFKIHLEKEAVFFANNIFGLTVNLFNMNPIVRDCLENHKDSLDASKLQSNLWVHNVNLLLKSNKSDEEIEKSLTAKLKELKVEPKPDEMQAMMENIKQYRKEQLKIESAKINEKVESKMKEIPNVSKEKITEEAEAEVIEKEVSDEENEFAALDKFYTEFEKEKTDLLNEIKASDEAAVFSAPIILKPDDLNNAPPELKKQLEIEKEEMAAQIAKNQEAVQEVKKRRDSFLELCKSFAQKNPTDAEALKNITAQLHEKIYHRNYNENVPDIDLELSGGMHHLYPEQKAIIDKLNQNQENISLTVEEKMGLLNALKICRADIYSTYNKNSARPDPLTQNKLNAVTACESFIKEKGFSAENTLECLYSLKNLKTVMDKKQPEIPKPPEEKVQKPVVPEKEPEKSAGWFNTFSNGFSSIRGRKKPEPEIKPEIPNLNRAEISNKIDTVINEVIKQVENKLEKQPELQSAVRFTTTTH